MHPPIFVRELRDAERAQLEASLRARSTFTVLLTAKVSAEVSDSSAEESPKRGSPSEELLGPIAWGRGPELEETTQGITPLPYSDGFTPRPCCRAAKPSARPGS
jgi:hypothetical protein